MARRRREEGEGRESKKAKSLRSTKIVEQTRTYIRRSPQNQLLIKQANHCELSGGCLTPCTVRKQ